MTLFVEYTKFQVIQELNADFGGPSLSQLLLNEETIGNKVTYLSTKNCVTSRDIGWY
jgi:hypothetical protein